MFPRSSAKMPRCQKRNPVCISCPDVLRGFEVRAFTNRLEEIIKSPIQLQVVVAEIPSDLPNMTVTRRITDPPYIAIAWQEEGQNQIAISQKDISDMGWYEKSPRCMAANLAETLVHEAGHLTDAWPRKTVHGKDWKISCYQICSELLGCNLEGPKIVPRAIEAVDYSIYWMLYGWSGLGDYYDSAYHTTP